MDILRPFNGSRKDVESLIASGDTFRDARNWLAAAEQYRSALGLNDKLAHIWVQYGHALKESRQSEAAEDAYCKALALEDDAETHLQLGHLHKIMGRKREAEADYLSALERDPGFAEARSELIRLGWSGAKLRSRLSSSSVALPHDQAVVAFELSDLIDHLHRTRYPTGIQRVQLALGAALAGAVETGRVHFVYYDHLESDFFEVQQQQVLDIVDLVDRHREDDDRQAIVDRVRSDVVTAHPFDFPEGSYLVNVGTSWGFLNYFLSLRDVKRRKNVRYVPLVHDCIPLIYPEFCAPNLVCDFINWMSQMLGHADVVLTNSENTKRDVIRFAGELETKLPPLEPVRLNGEYRDHLSDVDIHSDRTTMEVLSSHNLDVEDFVLFVSTIEPRKNHALALNAWSRLLKSRSPDRVPLLVCVGSSGWMNEAFHLRLGRDELLRSKIVVLSDVSDAVLQELYGRCLFTIFPSLYEGWGLPISEALAHGKVPLVSNVSSHPEAGGDLAIYFDLNSEADFQSKLQRLIDNGDERRAHEGKIQAASALRSWSEIGNEILGLVDRHFVSSPVSDSYSLTARAPSVAGGQYYSFARNRAPSIQSMWNSADLYRAGSSWHAPEPFGCWVRGLTADIFFNVDPAVGSNIMIYLHWSGSSGADNVVNISLPGTQWTKIVMVKNDQVRWDAIPVRFAPSSNRDVRIRIAAKTQVDFAIASEGRDRRKASVALKGFYICSEADSVQRIAILEAIQLNDLEPIARKFKVPTLL